MFDVGFTELLLIGVVSLVVIGPERLPDVARTAGKWIGKMQRFVRGVKTDIANELDSGELKKLIGDQRDQIDELRKIVGSSARELESSTRDAVRGARKKLTELEDAAARADGQADGEADADADVVRPEGPSTPPVPPAAPARTPAEGSAAAAARNIGQRNPSTGQAAATTPAASVPSGETVRTDAAASKATGGAVDDVAPAGGSAAEADSPADDIASRRTGSDS